jgi:hypothetical protein
MTSTTETTTWARPGAVGLIVRGLGLAVLLVAGLAALITVDPPTADLQTLLRDLRAGHVQRIDYESWQLDEPNVRWSTGPLRWWRLDASSLTSFTTNAEDGTQEHVDLRATIEREIRASGHHVEPRQLTSTKLWTANIPWAPLAIAATLVWILTLLTMLGTREHHYANRWAWFWLMTSGAAGTLIYLWLERQPLAGPRRLRERDPAQRIRGGYGFLLALVLSIAVGIVGYGLHKLVGAAPRYQSGLMITPVMTPR